MDAWLETHAAFEVPLGQAVHAAGGPAALADDPDSVRAVIRLMRQNLAAMPRPACPHGFVALQALPEGLLVAVLRHFLTSPTAAYSVLAGCQPPSHSVKPRMRWRGFTADFIMIFVTYRYANGGHPSNAGDRRPSPAFSGADWQPTITVASGLTDTGRLRSSTREVTEIPADRS